MNPPARHREQHRTDRIGWLRAAVLGANDGIVSTASLLVGVAAASAGHAEILVAGIAGLVAGAMSMAAGEYVSVKSQAETEEADLARERAELQGDPEAEHVELAGDLREAGARARAGAPGGRPAHGARRARRARARRTRHLRGGDGATHPGGAGVGGRASRWAPRLPLLTTWLAPCRADPAVIAASLVFLAVLGAVAARTGGAPILARRRARDLLGRARHGVTAGVGRLFGTVV